MELCTFELEDCRARAEIRGRPAWLGLQSRRSILPSFLGNLIRGHYVPIEKTIYKTNEAKCENGETETRDLESKVDFHDTLYPFTQHYLFV